MGIDGVRLVGRERELSTILATTRQARTGRSVTLVVHGDAGVGKTVLIDRAARAEEAAGTRVERMVAAEFELELPYAGLHALAAGLLDHAHALPDPQHAALDAAFGRSDAPSPTPFLVGLALLGLLTNAAAERPLLCVVDDAHWLDAASAAALAFAARRLQADSVALLFGTRTIREELAGLPVLRVDGLADDDALALLTRAAPGPIDRRLRDQLLTEARGNPLALLELPRALSAAQRAGGFALADAPTLQTRIEDSVLTQLRELSADARTLLLLAAADATGEPSLLWGAADAAGLDAGAWTAVEHAGALALDTRVRFRHPLVRSAVYRAAATPERRSAHAALAEATDAEVDPDRRAWHRAHAASEPDEEVAAELEASASRARARGGAGAAAAFLERAAHLSPDRSRQAARTLAAAQATFDAGAPEPARRLSRSVQTALLSPRDTILAEALALDIEYALHRDTRSAAALLELAKRLEHHDQTLAGAMYTRALYRSIFEGGLTDLDEEHDPGTRRAPRFGAIAREVLAATDRRPATAADRLVRGLALLKLDEREQALPVMRAALTELLAAPPSSADLAWVPIGCNAAIELWDQERLRATTARGIDLARTGGELTPLPLFLNFSGVVTFNDGRLDHAAAVVSELRAVQNATGDPFPPYHEALTAAWSGDAERIAALLAELRHGAAERTEGAALSTANFAEAIYANAAGDFARTVRLGREELPHIMDVSYTAAILGELVEAAVRTGDLSLAREALGHFETITSPAGGDWALGMLAAARAQFGDAEAAAEALERLGRAGFVVYAARVRLCAGERLRRAGQRDEARAELRSAHATFAERGAQGFAARAARELAETGEIAPVRGPDVAGALTAQERTIARLASEGLTNREIGARLFLSDRTIEYHLRKVFHKLAISSRRQLARALGA